MSVKSSILEYIESLPSRSDKKVMSGQNLAPFENNPWHEHDHFFNDLYTTIGEFPLLMGCALRRWNPVFTQGSIDDRLWLMYNHWESGGLVYISPFFNSPYGGGASAARGVDWTLPDCITPGEPEYTDFMGRLSDMADDLDMLISRGVVVMFRPFHEMNLRANWWWAPTINEWDTDPDRIKSEFVDLWEFTHDYFAVTRGFADNIIWVYGTANRQTAVGRPTLDDFYPGDDFTDIVGTSCYEDDFKIRGTGYAELQSIGKPMMFTEAGRDFPNVCAAWSNTVMSDSIRNNYPDMTGFFCWESYGTTCLAIIDNDDPDFLGDDWIIWRGEFPLNRGIIGCTNDQGTVDDWDTDNDADNDLDVTVAAALNGSIEGMEVTIDDANQTSYARYITPKHNRIKFSCWVDPNTISMPAGSYMTVCRLGTSGAPWRVADILLNYDGADYNVRLDLIHDDATQDSSPLYTISDAPHLIEATVVRATSAMAGDGYGKLRIDGVEVLGDDTPLVDNYDIWDDMDEMHAGAIWVGSALISGVFYVDEIFGEGIPLPAERKRVAAGVGRGIGRGVR